MIRLPLVLALFGLSACHARTGPQSQTPQPALQAKGPLHLHAHNDYEHAHPLFDALAQGFDSVEADLWLRDGVLVVSHSGVSVKGTLEDLYLRPMQARVDRQGSVQRRGEVFYLWLDLKEGSPELQEALTQVLARYPMFTAFDDRGALRPGPVVAILTGHDAAKRALVERPAPRLYVRDSNDLAESDPPADGRWRYYAIKTSHLTSWDGRGEIPAAERRKLAQAIELAHAKGREVRLWSTPETEAFWRVSAELGIDFVGTDKLAELSAFLAPLKGAPAHP